MKLVQDTHPQCNHITGYTSQGALINGQTHEGSVLVSPDQLARWRPQGFAELQRADFAALLAWEPAVVLLGTGGQIRFPAAGLLRDLHAAGIGVEVMDVGAACRTFNALACEGRRVLAALLFA